MHMYTHPFKKKTQTKKPPNPKISHITKKFVIYDIPSGNIFQGLIHSFIYVHSL